MGIGGNYPLIGIATAAFPLYLCIRKTNCLYLPKKCSDGYLPMRTTGLPPPLRGSGLTIDSGIATRHLHFFLFSRSRVGCLFPSCLTVSCRRASRVSFAPVHTYTNRPKGLESIRLLLIIIDKRFLHLKCFLIQFQISPKNPLLEHHCNLLRIKRLQNTFSICDKKRASALEIPILLRLDKGFIVTRQSSYPPSIQAQSRGERDTFGAHAPKK